MMNENERWPLPEGWAWTTLGNIRRDSSQSINPARHPEQFFELYSVPSYPSERPEIVRGSEVGSSKQAVKEDSVLLCKINPRINRVWVVGNYSDYPKIASTEWIAFDAVVEISPKYLRYYMMQDGFRDHLAHNASGVGGSLMRVRPSTLTDYPFPLPPLPTQHHIVAEIEKQFTRLDAAVAALRRAKANLARYKAAVLKAAVEGRLVAQSPNDEPASVLLERILAERRAQWQAANPKKKYVEPKGPDVAGLGELPVGWVWATVEQITSLIQYGHTTSAVYEPVGPKFLRITDIQDGFVDWDAVPWCHCTQEEYEKYRVSSGDIVFARTGATTGKSYLIKDCPNTVFASYLIRLQLTKPFDQRYLAYYFDSPFYWSRITSEQKGSAQPGVNATILSTLEVPVPPLAEQSRIVNEVERCLSVIHASDQIIDANLARAERLRQGVLGRAFRGELVGQLSSTDNALLK